jgi:hypothetical protein
MSTSMIRICTIEAFGNRPSIPSSVKASPILARRRPATACRGESRGAYHWGEHNAEILCGDLALGVDDLTIVWETSTIWRIVRSG